MGNGLRYETGRDMPPGMQELAADKIVHQLKNAAPVAAQPEFYCDSCGSPTSNTRQIGDITLHTCDKCRDRIRREVEWESIGETYRENRVMCPFCGYEYDPYESLQFDEDEPTDAVCECCGRHFKVEVSTVRYYSTRRSVSEMPEDWAPEKED